MKMPKEDVLNALVTDLLADQVIRALELGFTRKEVEDAVARGEYHGVCDFAERRKEIRKADKIIGSFK